MFFLLYHVAFCDRYINAAEFGPKFRSVRSTVVSDEHAKEKPTTSLAESDSIEFRMRYGMSECQSEISCAHACRERCTLCGRIIEPLMKRRRARVRFIRKSRLNPSVYHA